jgi:hypothetical protein
MNDYLLTTVRACSVARIDSRRLNEHIFNKEYNIAPATVPGRARLFSENDLICLFIFARLVERDNKASEAGKIAAAIHNKLFLYPDAKEATILEFANYPGICEAQMPEGPEKLWYKAGTLLRSQTFHLEGIRLLVRKAVEEERKIIGDPDSE